MKQSEQELYDVIIFGAGASGLAVASELSKELKVLVFDRKRDLKECTKSWLIPDVAISIGGAEDILPFMKNGVKRFLADTYQGVDVQWQANYKYHFAEEHQLLGYWGKQLNKNGSEILLDCWYEDSFISDSGVVVRTSKGEFKGKLLIDASGGHTPLRERHSRSKDLYWWSVCGAIVDFPDGLPEGMEVGDYQLWQTFRDTNADGDASLFDGRPVWEYEVLDEKSAFVFIFYLEPARIPHDDMEKVFEHVFRNEASTKDFHNASVREVKYGWYPSGGPHSQQIASDRVAFIGSAACWTSPCGWGASFIVANYKGYARELVKAVKQDALDRKSLNKLIHPSSRSRYEVLFDQLATHFLSFASADQLNSFIELFDPNGMLGEEGPLLCEKLFTLTIGEKEAIIMLKVMMKKMGGLALLKTMPPSAYWLCVKLVVGGLGIIALDLLGKKDTGAKSESGFSIAN